MSGGVGEGGSRVGWVCLWVMIFFFKFKSLPHSIRTLFTWSPIKNDLECTWPNQCFFLVLFLFHFVIVCRWWCAIVVVVVVFAACRFYCLTLRAFTLMFLLLLYWMNTLHHWSHHIWLLQLFITVYDRRSFRTANWAFGIWMLEPFLIRLINLEKRKIFGTQNEHTGTHSDTHTHTRASDSIEIKWVKRGKRERRWGGAAEGRVCKSKRRISGKRLMRGQYIETNVKHFYI